MQTSVEEYLHTSYRPDRDYIDGEAVERNAGERKHGRLQIRIGSWLLARESQWRIQAFTEVRVRVGDHRYRIPDVIALSADAPDEPVVIPATA